MTLKRASRAEFRLAKGQAGPNFCQRGASGQDSPLKRPRVIPPLRFLPWLVLTVFPSTLFISSDFIGKFVASPLFKDAKFLLVIEFMPAIIYHQKRNSRCGEVAVSILFSQVYVSQWSPVFILLQVCLSIEQMLQINVDFLARNICSSSFF